MKKWKNCLYLAYNIIVMIYERIQKFEILYFGYHTTYFLVIVIVDKNLAKILVYTQTYILYGRNFVQGNYTYIYFYIMHKVCDLNPCQNGGTCDSSSDPYTCHCQSGFTGTDCDARKQNVFPFITTCHDIRFVFILTDVQFYPWF